MIDGSSFSGLLTRVEIGHMRSGSFAQPTWGLVSATEARDWSRLSVAA
jgi:hypothetical protein